MRLCQGVDIGAYSTCSHFCRYCYANFSRARVEANRRMHDGITAAVRPADREERVTVRDSNQPVRPADDGQMRLGFHDAGIGGG